MALPPSARPPGPQLSRGPGPEPAQFRMKEGSGEQLRAFRDAGLRPAARLPHTRLRRALTSCPRRAQRSGNSRIVVDVSSVGAPHKPGGLPQWTRCTELVPKLLVAHCVWPSQQSANSPHLTSKQPPTAQDVESESPCESREFEIHRTARWPYQSVGRRFEPDGAHPAFVLVRG